MNQNQPVKPMRLLLMNGPNLNMLGIREPGVYGSRNLASIEAEARQFAYAHGASIDCFQSNHEGELVEKIHSAHTAYDAVVYNPGAHTHYSYAIRDAIGSIDTPVIEVHISDVDSREPFRAISVVAPACVAQVKGFGTDSYLVGLALALDGWNTRLGEGFEERYAKGRVILGGVEGGVEEAGLLARVHNVQAQA